MKHPEKPIKIPYKTCRKWIFLSYFRKMDPKSIKKALGFSLKVDAVSPLRGNAKIQWRYGVLAHAEKLFKIPYKTCRKLIIPGPFLQNGLRTIKKALRFSLQNDCILRLCKTSKNH